MLKIHEDRNIVFISLNRPEVRNAFNPELILELTEKMKVYSTRSELRAVVLSGEGSVFCAGADLQWMKSMVTYSIEQNQKDAEDLFDLFVAIKNCSIPVVCQVHGAAFGGALGILAASDYVLAEESTQLCFSEVKIGLAPAVISAFVMAKCQKSVMQALMMSGKVFLPQEVLGSGLIHQVFHKDKTAESLAKVIRHFEEASPLAVRETKKLCQSYDTPIAADARAMTTSLISYLRVSNEGQEGINAFLEKRNPGWKK